MTSTRSLRGPFCLTAAACAGPADPSSSTKLNCRNGSIASAIVADTRATWNCHQPRLQTCYLLRGHMLSKFFQRVSQSPTNPQARPPGKTFDVAGLYQSPATVAADDGQAAAALPLDEKLRQAYFWIVNHAIISPFYDIEYAEGPSQTFVFGDAQSGITLPSGQSYCSFVLLPLLNFAVRRKCLLVGGPGRGKTSGAMLMGVLAGYS